MIDFQNRPSKSRPLDPAKPCGMATGRVPQFEGMSRTPVNIIRAGSALEIVGCSNYLKIMKALLHAQASTKLWRECTLQQNVISGIMW